MVNYLKFSPKLNDFRQVSKMIKIWGRKPEKIFCSSNKFWGKTVLDISSKIVENRRHPDSKRFLCTPLHTPMKEATNWWDVFEWLPIQCQNGVYQTKYEEKTKIGKQSKPPTSSKPKRIRVMNRCFKPTSTFFFPVFGVLRSAQRCWWCRVLI